MKELKSPVVRLVGENVETGIFYIREAINMAENRIWTLVEISPTANPPVCKVIDYKKFLFDRKRKQKEIKAKRLKLCKRNPAWPAHR